MNKSELLKIIDIIPEIFQSKPKITAETTIMGVPAWAVVVALVSYLVWDHTTKKIEIQQLKAEYNQLKAQVQQINSQVDLRVKNSILKERSKLRTDP